MTRLRASLLAILGLVTVVVCALAWYRHTTEAQEPIEVTICAFVYGPNVQYGTRCDPDHIVRVLRMPRKLLPTVPKGVTRYVGGAEIEIRSSEYLQTLSPYLAERRKIDRELARDIKVSAAAGETLADFMKRTEVSGMYQNRYPSLEARLTAQAWINENGFTLRRMLPIAQRGNILPYSTDLLLNDQTLLRASCANDPTLGVLVGCRVYSYTASGLRIDYGNVITTPETLRRSDQEINKIIDHFTIFKNGVLHAKP